MFFPLKFAQSEPNLVNLDRIQREIRRALWDLDASYRHSTRYEFHVAKQRLHKHVRDSVEIVKDINER
jgi:hypothetical protein